MEKMGINWILKKKIRSSEFKRNINIAHLLKIHPSTFSRKINGLLIFTKDEKEDLARILNCKKKKLFKKT